MKRRQPFLRSNLFACLLAFAAMGGFAGLVWMKIKPIKAKVSTYSLREGSDHSSRSSSMPIGSAHTDHDYIKPGEIFPLKRLIEDCDTLPRGETSSLCYDRVRKCVFLVTRQRVIREFTAPSSARDVTVEHRDAYGNRTTRRLSPTYSKVDVADVLITYYDAEGKRSDVPVPIERPEIFRIEMRPKVNLEDIYNS
ncbi:hypothetical protein OVA24_06845 [Luteolibacter sp. SL250]|uniref:hypothetical protein n=1 Tax=Luteolibacter sp. SL250 TaxID=2995170 RepID=UPI0022706854|nr:hypothetical protein [Luteolibacter sp. SL250]WAC21099.1 hypothetical protein OVA24_06845 [Luteolibacter sp. SL250]